MLLTRLLLQTCECVYVGFFIITSSWAVENTEAHWTHTTKTCSQYKQCSYTKIYANSSLMWCLDQRQIQSSFMCECVCAELLCGLTVSSWKATLVYQLQVSSALLVWPTLSVRRRSLWDSSASDWKRFPTEESAADKERTGGWIIKAVRSCTSSTFSVYS